MTEKPWSNRNNLLNSFQKKIEKQTHGRLSHLELEFRENGVAVFANSDCYYDMQLALHAIQQFSHENPQVTPTHLEFNINGHAMSLNHQNINVGTRTLCPEPSVAGINPQYTRFPTRPFKSHPSKFTALPTALS